MQLSRGRIVCTFLYANWNMYIFWKQLLDPPSNDHLRKYSHFLGAFTGLIFQIEGVVISHYIVSYIPQGVLQIKPTKCQKTFIHDHLRVTPKRKLILIDSCVIISNIRVEINILTAWYKKYFPFYSILSTPMTTVQWFHFFLILQAANSTSWIHLFTSSCNFLILWWLLPYSASHKVTEIIKNDWLNAASMFLHITYNQTIYIYNCMQVYKHNTPSKFLYLLKIIYFLSLNIALIPHLNCFHISHKNLLWFNIVHL